MLYLKCPFCKKEYTVVPCKIKPCVLFCLRCGWTNAKTKRIGPWFSDWWWGRCRNDVEKWLKRNAFMDTGFPVDLLKGRVAMREGILLFDGTLPGKRMLVEYRPNHDGVKPVWLDCDSTGRPRSSMRLFHTWLHNEYRDTVFACDSPKTAVRVMEAYWRAEGRLPDVTWSSCHGSIKKSPVPDLTFYDRHVICLGARSLKNVLESHGTKVNTWLDTTGGVLPENLYIACRTLEEKANDPRNNSDPVELPMAARRPFRGRVGNKLCKERKTAEMLEVQAEGRSHDAVPASVPGA